MKQDGPPGFSSHEIEWEQPRRQQSCFWCDQQHPAAHPLSVCPGCVAKYTTMRLLDMDGFFPLNREAVDKAVRLESPGNYALGYMDGDTFSAFYVGRSDSDVRRCLRSWVDLPSRYGGFRSPAKASWGTRSRAQFPIAVPALDRVGNTESNYTHFAFSYAHCAQAAYAKECRNYDDFGGSYKLDNETRPISPSRRRRILRRIK